MPFDNDKTVKKAFTGDWSPSGYGANDGKGWSGDELVLRAKNEKIRLYYFDEERKGFFDGLKSSLTIKT